VLQNYCHPQFQTEVYMMQSVLLFVPLHADTVILEPELLVYPPIPMEKEEKIETFAFCSNLKLILLCNG